MAAGAATGNRTASGGPSQLSNGARKRWRWPQWSDLIAKLMAGIVLALGLLMVVWPIAKHGQHFGRDPDAPRTVRSTSLESQWGGGATTTVVRGPSGTMTTLVTPPASPQTKLTVSYGEDKRSLLDRAFGEGGFFVFRIALACIAAFLAGAIVQRALRGKFTIKLPFVEFGDLPDAAAASLDVLKTGMHEQINAVVHQTEKALAESAGATTAALDALRKDFEQINAVVHQTETALAENAGATTAALEALRKEFEQRLAALEKRC